MKNLIVLSFSGSLLLSAPALAQDLSEDPATVETEIVVLATGFSQPRDTTGQAITVIDRAELDRLQSVGLADALRSLPGASVAQRGPVGGQTSVFLRGGNSSQTLVLIDGVRINDPSSPNAAVDFGSLLAGNAGRVEVLRGPNAIIWGSQAMGGVVNIESARPSSVLKARGALEYGAHDTFLSRANLSGGAGPLAMSLGGTFYRTDGISAIAGGLERDGSQTWALNGRVSADLAPDVSLDFRGYYNNSRVDFDSEWSGGAEALAVARNRQFAGYAGIDFALADGRWKNRLAYTRTDIRRVGTDPVVYSYNNYVVSGVIDRFEYRSAFDLAAFASLAFGGEHERTSSSTSYEGADPDVADTSMTGGYAQLTLNPVGGLSLTGGVRHDEYSSYGGHTALGGNLAWSLNGGNTVLRATYAEGFRAPTLTEGQPPYGNPALKPETARNFDVGIEQSLLDDQVKFGLTWFNRRSTNLIVYSWASQKSENIGQVDADGLEFALQLRPRGNVRVDASYTLANAINRSGAYDGKRQQLRPQHSGSLSVDWDTPLGISIGATALLMGDSFDDQDNLVPLDGYALLTLRASLPLGRNLELYGRIENLADVRYETVAGYGTYGRSAYAGVRVKW